MTLLFAKVRVRREFPDAKEEGEIVSVPPTVLPSVHDKQRAKRKASYSGANYQYGFGAEFHEAANFMGSGEIEAMIKKSRRCWIPFITVLLISVWLTPAGAEDQHGDHKEFHRHHMGLLLGNTEEGHENGFTIGADYEYRQTELIGLGGVTEYISGDFDSFVLAGLVFIHPYRDLRFVLGPGFENRDSENKFFLRAGIGYRFHVGKDWTIAPEFNVDFFERDEALVYGVSIGRGF